MAMGAEDYSSTNDRDDSLLVKFFIKPRLNKVESEKQGRPIYRDVEHIDIKVVGSRNGGACRPATKEDKNRFPRHYAAFKERVNDDEIIEGTMLEEWPAISRALVEELKFFNVRTVEQLSAMSDTHASKFMGLMEMRGKAKIWLDHAAKIKSQQELRNELDAIKENNEHLRQINESLEQRLNDLTLSLSEKKPETRAKKTVAKNANNDDG